MLNRISSHRKLHHRGRDGGVTKKNDRLREKRRLRKGGGERNVRNRRGRRNKKKMIKNKKRGRRE